MSIPINSVTASNSSTAVNSLIRAALSASSSNTTSTDDDFESIYAATRRAFRPNQSPSRTGRRKCRTISRTVLLLRRNNVDFYPAANEICFLNTHGLGKHDKAVFFRNWSMQKVENYIISLYPEVPLNLVGFRYAKSSKARAITVLENLINAEDMFQKLGQGNLIILPNRDIPLLTRQMQNENNEQPQPVNRAHFPTSINLNNEQPIPVNRDDSVTLLNERPRSLRSGPVNRAHFPSSINLNERPLPVTEMIDYRDERDDRNTNRDDSVTLLNERPRSFRSGPGNEQPGSVTRTRSIELICHDYAAIPVDSDASSSYGFPTVLEPVCEDQDITDTNLSTNINYKISPLDIPGSIPELPSLPVDAEVMAIYISRADCVLDMMNLYADMSVDILQKKLSVNFLGENGSDIGGLTKELFSVFWKEAEILYFSGEDCIVPFLPLHRLKKEINKFTILGKIFTHMFLLVGMVPPKISRIVYLIICEAEITTQVLQEDFLLYLTPIERNTIKKSLTDFNNLSEVEMETLINTFSSYNFFDNPSEYEINDQIQVIANEILIEKPRQLIQRFKEGIPQYILNTYWKKCNEESVTFMLATHRPTIKKILGCLKTEEDLTNDQSKVFHYLKLYVSTLNSDTLLDFLFFITGSYSLPIDITIHVSFNTLTGNVRRPITHTCSNTLELSCYYSTYQEFKIELNTYLKSEYSYQYTQA